MAKILAKSVIYFETNYRRCIDNTNGNFPLASLKVRAWKTTPAVQGEVR